MSIEEIKNKAYYEVKKAQENYRDRLIKYLEENNLKDKVIRAKDGKIGTLHTEFSWDTKIGYQLVFYPLKKDGTESRKYEIVWRENGVTEDFKPYED